MTRFLTERTDFDRVPAIVGAVEYDTGRGQTRSVAILSQYVANEGDAWRQALSAMDRFVEDALPRDRVLHVPVSTPMRLATRALPDDVAEAIGPYLTQVEQLGRTTARMHAALASDPDDPDFAPEPFTALSQRSVYQSMRTRARRTQQALALALQSLPADVADRVAGLADRDEDLLDRFQHLKDQRLTGARTRTHGDFHLGQVLWTGRGYVVLDFEGEPARPLGERRLKRSPLSDVAGMLRSYHYAGHVRARAHVDRGGYDTPADVERLTAAASWWGTWTGARFLRGWLDEAPTDVLPDTQAETSRLLDAYLLEKSLYELTYELDNRPDWVDIPLQGILRQLDSSI